MMNVTPAQNVNGSPSLYSFCNARTPKCNVTYFYCILIQGIEEAAAVTLLPWLLKEKGGKPEDIIKICMV